MGRTRAEGEPKTVRTRFITVLLSLGLSMTALAAFNLEPTAEPKSEGGRAEGLRSPALSDDGVRATGLRAEGLKSPALLSESKLRYYGGQGLQTRWADVQPLAAQGGWTGGGVRSQGTGGMTAQEAQGLAAQQFAARGDSAPQAYTPGVGAGGLSAESYQPLQGMTSYPQRGGAGNAYSPQAAEAQGIAAEQKTAAAVGILSQILGVSAPQLLAVMPRGLRDIVFKSVSASAQQQAKQAQEQQEQEYSAALADGQLKQLASFAEGTGLRPPQQTIATPATPQGPTTGAGAWVANAQQRSPAYNWQNLQQGTAIQPQQPVPANQPATPPEPAASQIPPTKIQAPTAPAQLPPPKFKKSTQPDQEFELVRPHPKADRKILANDKEALAIMILILLVFAVLAIAMRLVFGRRSQQNKPLASPYGRGKPKGPQSPTFGSTSPLEAARGQQSDGYTEASTAESDMDLAMVADVIGDEIQEGLETVQGGVTAVVEQVAELGGYVGGLVGLTQEAEEESPPDVFIAYRGDSVGLTGQDIAEDLEERFSELGYNCYLFGSEPDHELDQEEEEVVIMHLLASKVYVALVDNKWTEHEMNLRCLAASILGQETRNRPTPFIVYDHELQYRDDLAVRNFKLAPSNSHALARAADLGLVFDQIRHHLPSEPGAHYSKEEEDEDEESEHFMHRTWPIEARLRSQLSQRRSILAATEQARSGAQADGANHGSGRNQLILPTFTRPSIRFDNVDKS